MSKANPTHSDIDFNPKREKRGPANVTTLLPAILNDEVDPTREIRTAVLELQAAARDARDAARQMEQERDQIAEQLEECMCQLADQRAAPGESRHQFMEISALLRDRDAALDASERHQRKIAELERKLEAASRERNNAQRQRDDAVRQREDAARRRAENNQETEATAAQLAAVQKQVLSIRQARDAAQAQTRNFESRLQTLQDELAELGYARDAAQQTARVATEELSALRAQLQTAIHDRDTVAGHLTSLSTELDNQRAKLLDLTAERSQANQAGTEQSAALAEAREQVTRLTQERDAARTRAQEQATELEDLRRDLQAQREASAAATTAAAERDALQRQLAQALADRDTHAAREKEYLDETIGQQERLAQLTDQLMAAQRGREEALHALNSAQEQIDQLIREREPASHQGAEEAELRIAELQTELDAALDRVARAEKQRHFAIELATQLDNAKRELIRLTADLAEARLQAKFSRTTVVTAADEPHGLQITFDSPPRPLPPIEVLSAPLTEKDASAALRAMKQCHDALTREGEDLSLLNDLHEHAHAFAERARVSGCVALHRLLAAYATFIEQLYLNPDQVNPSTQRTMAQTLEFLGLILKQPDYSLLKDPATATVYVVDDDLANCDSIKLGLESAMLRTQTAQEPAVALAELAGSPYDLIFLDVILPHTNGFELCQQIRQLPIHATTPIVFITGMTTTENRVQSSLSGGNDFVAKPFNLAELSVKALTLLLKNSLNTE